MDGIRSEWSAEAEIFDGPEVRAFRARERAAIAAHAETQAQRILEDEAAEARTAALAWGALSRNPAGHGYRPTDAASLRDARDSQIRAFLSLRRYARQQAVRVAFLRLNKSESAELAGAAADLARADGAAIRAVAEIA